MHKSMTHAKPNKSIILPDIAKSNETIDHAVVSSTNEEYKNAYQLMSDQKSVHNSRQIVYFSFIVSLVELVNHIILMLYSFTLILCNQYQL